MDTQTQRKIQNFCCLPAVDFTEEDNNHISATRAHRKPVDRISLRRAQRSFTVGIVHIGAMSNSSSIYNTCLEQAGGDNKDNQVLECIATEFQADAEILTITSNVFFLIYSASLVFLMQAGFAMICSGSVRKKNVQNTMLKNLLDACGAAIAFFMFGCK